jgi:hypothetical protein
MRSWCFADQTVMHTVTVVNTGNVQLRNVLPTTTLTAAASNSPQPVLPTYSCTLNGGTAADLPAGGFAILPQAGTLVCTAMYVFAAVDTIEAGDLTCSTQVAVSGATSKPGTTRTVNVHSLPQLDVSANNATCAEPVPNDASECQQLQRLARLEMYGQCQPHLWLISCAHSSTRAQLKYSHAFPL